MAQPGPEAETASMLGRSVTFKRNPIPAKYEATAATFLARIVGEKTAPVNRVSESLDYEPIQNKLFYDRMKSRKEGKKKLYGCVEGRVPPFGS